MKPILWLCGGFCLLNNVWIKEGEIARLKTTYSRSKCRRITFGLKHQMNPCGEFARTLGRTLWTDTFFVNQNENAGLDGH